MPLLATAMWRGPANANAASDAGAAKEKGGSRPPLSDRSSLGARSAHGCRIESAQAKGDCANDGEYRQVPGGQQPSGLFKSNHVPFSPGCLSKRLIRSGRRRLRIVA